MTYRGLRVFIWNIFLSQETKFSLIYCIDKSIRCESCRIIYFRDPLPLEADDFRWFCVSENAQKSSLSFSSATIWKNTSNQSKYYQINQSFHFLTKLNQDCQASKRNHKNLRYRARLICTWFSRMTQLSKLFSCPAGSATDMSETGGPSSSSKIRQITGRLLVGGIDWNKKDKNFIAQ